MSDNASMHGRFPVKFASIAVAATGDTQIVAAVPGARIRVIHYHLSSADAKTVQWRSGSGGTNLTGAISLAANGGVSATSDTGLFEAAEGVGLFLNNSAAGVTGGSLAYVELP